MSDIINITSIEDGIHEGTMSFIESEIGDSYKQDAYDYFIALIEKKSGNKLSDKDKEYYIDEGNYDENSSDIYLSNSIDLLKE